MNPKPHPDAALPRFDPRFIDAAKRQAHELRREAIDDAFRWLGRWLSRPFASRSFTSRAKTIRREQPCHS